MDEQAIKDFIVKKIIEMYPETGDEEYKGWCKGNALKYLFRAGKKDNEVQDLSKCSVYVNWAIKAMEV